MLTITVKNRWAAHNRPPIFVVRMCAVSAQKFG